jgi:hypothetical protein
MREWSPEEQDPDLRETLIAGSRRRELWFAVLGGMSAWAVHFWAGFALVEIACRTTFPAFSALGLGGLELLMAAITLLFGGVAVAALVVSWRVRERAGAVAEPDGDGPNALATFMGRTGLYLSGFFLAAIVLAAVPAFVLQGCG